MGKGSGLGLSMVHGVATQSGGGLAYRQPASVAAQRSMLSAALAPPLGDSTERDTPLATVHKGATILVSTTIQACGKSR